MKEDELFNRLAEIAISRIEKQEDMVKDLDHGRFRLQIIQEGHFNGTILNKNLMFNRHAKVYFRFLLNLASELSKENFMALNQEIAEELYKAGTDLNLLSLINESHAKPARKKEQKKKDN